MDADAMDDVIAREARRDAREMTIGTWIKMQIR